MPNRERKLHLAVEKLSKYYDLRTTRQLSNYLAAGGAGTSINPIGSAPTEAASASSNSGMETLQDTMMGEIINAFLDVTIGAYTTKELLEYLANRLGIISPPTGEDANSIQQLQERYQQIFHIVSDAQYSHDMPYPEFLTIMKNASIKELVSDTNLIAEGSEIPSKEKPGLSVILSQTSRISIANRFSNACSLFFNAIPATEISRAIPYLEVNILIPDVAVQRSEQNRLVSPTLYKFLLGGTQAQPGTVLNQLSIANEQQRQPISPDRPEIYTNVGMEAFLSPQTLVNPDAAINVDNFGNIVLDKFRPFMSLKDFNFSVRQAYSAYGYGSGQLSLVLHDRSRLNEISQFVRPDIRGNTEILIEWGWCHMDSENNSNPNNIYADIINGMRQKQKFQVTNSEFTFNDNGEVDITLQIATVGEGALTTESIATGDVDITNSLEQINSIIDTIAQIRDNSPTLNPPESTTTTSGTPAATATGSSSRSTRNPEIRGIQFLNTATEAYSNLVLTREQIQELRRLEASLRTLPATEDITRLRDLLSQLYGPGRDSSRAGPNRTSSSPLVEQLRSQIQNQIRDIMANLKKGEEDPFLIGTFNPTVDRRNRRLRAGAPRRPAPAEEAPPSVVPAPATPRRATTPGSAGFADYRIAEPSLGAEVIAGASSGAALVGAVAGPIGMAYGAVLGAGAAVAERVTRGSTTDRVVAAYSERLAATDTLPKESSTSSSGIQTETPETPEVTEAPEARADRVASEERYRREYPARLAAYNARLAASSPIPRGAVSLGNILSVFMGKPLAASNQFDDVQLVFYPFNEYAGFARYINIANFIINVEDFQEKYTEYRLQHVTRSGQFTIRDFWSFLTSNILDDPSQMSYGLTDTRGHALYRTETRTEDGRTTTSTVPVESDGARFTARLNEVLNDVTPDGSFRIPQLNFIIECLPGRTSSEGESSDPANEKTIARVHIFDERSSAYEGLGSILQTNRNGMLEVPEHSPVEAGAAASGASGTIISEVNINSQQNYEQLLRQAEANGIVVRGSEGGYEVVGGPEALKAFLYKTTPYIIHGAKNSLIKNANLTTITDQAANTLALVRSPTGNEMLRPNGQDLGNLPMQILPVELSVDSFGCPLLGYATQFFIDFNTNTTADDIYMVNGIEHKLSQGEYSSNIKFVALSSYGQYRNYIRELNTAVRQLDEINARRGAEPSTAAATPSSTSRRGGDRGGRRGRGRTSTEPGLRDYDVSTPRGAALARSVSSVGWATNPTNMALMALGIIPVSPEVPSLDSITAPDAPRAPELPSGERSAAAAEDSARRQVTAAETRATRERTDLERRSAEATATARGLSAPTAPSTPGGLTPTTPTTPTASTTPFTTLRGGAGGF